MKEYIKDVEGMFDSFHVSELRTIASYWHGGQFSPLYAFASSGSITPGLAKEALEAAKHAEMSEREHEEYEDVIDDPIYQAAALKTIASLEKGGKKKKGNPVRAKKGLTINEIGMWIDNDETLYHWWKRSRMAKNKFIKENRERLEAIIGKIMYPSYSVFVNNREHIFDDVADAQRFAVAHEKKTGSIAGISRTNKSKRKLYLIKNPITSKKAEGLKAKIGEQNYNKFIAYLSKDAEDNFDFLKTGSWSAIGQHIVYSYEQPLGFNGAAQMCSIVERGFKALKKKKQFTKENFVDLYVNAFLDCLR